jgi:hypothetical protein
MGSEIVIARMMRVQGSALRRATFIAWRSVSHRSGAAKHRAVGLSARISFDYMASHLSAWRGAVAAERAARRVHALMDNATLHHAFDAWARELGARERQFAVLVEKNKEVKRRCVAAAKSELAAIFMGWRDDYRHWAAAVRSYVKRCQQRECRAALHAVRELLAATGQTQLRLLAERHAAESTTPRLVRCAWDILKHRSVQMVRLQEFVGRLMPPPSLSVLQPKMLFPSSSSRSGSTPSQQQEEEEEEGQKGEGPQEEDDKSRKSKKRKKKMRQPPLRANAYFRLLVTDGFAALADHAEAERRVRGLATKAVETMLRYEICEV